MPVHGYPGPSLAPLLARSSPTTPTAQQANRSHAKLRGTGERANAQLESWKILAKLGCCPRRAGHLAKAIHSFKIERPARRKNPSMAISA